MIPKPATFFPPEIGVTPDSGHMRLVTNMEGRVIYVSQALAQMIKAVPATLKGVRIEDLLFFQEPSLVVAPEPLFAVDQNDSVIDLPVHWSTRLIQGTHSVFFRDNPALPLSMSFEWMQVGSGTRYLVATHIAPPQPLPVRQSSRQTNTAVPKIAIAEALARLNTVLPAPPTSVHKIFQGILERAKDTSGHMFLAMTDDMMIVIDAKGRVQSANPAFYSIIGDTPDQTTLSLFDRVIEADRARLHDLCALMTAATQTDDTSTFDTQIIRHDNAAQAVTMRLRRQGERLYVLARAAPARPDNLAHLTRQQQQLAEAEAIAHLGYWRWEVGADELTWSDEIYRIFGVNQDTFVPTRGQVEAMIRKRDLSRLAQVFERALIDHNTYGLEMCIIRESGEMRTVTCEGRCEIDAGGEVVALYGIIQDVTDRTRVERELREAKNAAERAYASKSKFLANMSHELRTPLNAIIGFSEMMQRQLLGPIGTPKYIDYVDGIRQSGEHLLDLISDILDMSKIEAGKFQLDLEEINITKLARLAITMVEARAREAGVNLRVDPQPNDAVHLIADRRALLQMMLNLLSNAIKFTAAGGTVTVAVDDVDHIVIVVVKDTGIGIPAHLIPVVTKPFEQVANHYTRAHDGSGLGLAITKELAMMHGGTLEIKSELGVGTGVTIKIPRG